MEIMKLIKLEAKNYVWPFKIAQMQKSKMDKGIVLIIKCVKVFEKR